MDQRSEGPNQGPNVLVVFSCFNPPTSLVKSIETIILLQFRSDRDETTKRRNKIICVDNNSRNRSTFALVKKSFPQVEIFFVKNPHYEWGAYRFAYERFFTEFDVFICLQDTIVITQRIDLYAVHPKQVYIACHYSGFHSHPNLKNEAHRRFIKGKEEQWWSGGDIQNTASSSKGRSSIIDTTFCVAQHNSFVIRKDTLKKLFAVLDQPRV